MRLVLRRLLVFVLKWLTRAVIRKYHPRIIAVTGSVGKSTTRELIVGMLGGHYRVRGSVGNYNTEIGVPLTVFGTTAGHGFLGWLKVLQVAASLLVRQTDYPEVLVLEMAADRPGDIRHLAGVAPPDIAVVTNVRNVHLEQYASVEAIAEEKSQLVRALGPDGVAILNFDDTRTRMMRALTQANAVFYGMTDEANVWLSDFTFEPEGASGTVNVRERDGSEVRSWPLTTGLLGVHQLSAVLAAFAVAYSVGVPPEEALAVAKGFRPLPGRGRTFTGAEGRLIIDDSYNASPQAVMASLDVLERMPKPRIAVLGEMRELGAAREAGHRSVGEYATSRVEYLVTVGGDAGLIAAAAKEAGLSADHVFAETTAAEATNRVKAIPGGSVLVKGSQAVYLERVVESLLADPRDAERLVKRPIPSDAP